MTASARRAHRQSNGATRAWLRRAILAAATVFGSSYFYPASVAAQEDASQVSDADRATARDAAKTGIQLYREQRYSEALLHLEKAQQLFDAPVHLLYIARCQRELGKLVEAGETYRSLKMTQLETDAPQAFRDAVNDAGAELTEVDGQIPKLVLQVSPKGAKPEIRIDDNAVPAAALGLPRPVNPGAHRIQVTAPGYAAQTKSLDVARGDQLELAFQLVRQSPTDMGAKPRPDTAPAKSPSDDRGKGAGLGFLGGLRLGVAAVGGDAGFAFVNPALADQPTELSEYFGAGLQLELRGGLRFGRYFTALLFVSAAAHTPASGLEGTLPGETSAAAGDVEFESSALTSTQGGVGLMIATPKPGFGYWGEIDLGLHSMKLQRSSVTGGCSLTVSSNAPVARLFGGVQFPLSQSVRLAPYLGLSLGRFTRADTTASDGCQDILATDAQPARELDISGDDQKNFTTLHLGVGGDFLLGG